jgi:hypothetical protein
MKLPIGEVEDARREFKGRDVLDKPATVARAVVAMLNAKGGVVWIGIGEHESRAVAAEPVDQPMLRKDALFNQLVDTIEPRLRDEVEIKQNAENSAVLEVHVRPEDGRGPYAQLKQGGRYYYRRVGSRVRDMTREEMQEAFGQSRTPESGVDAARELLEARKSLSDKVGLHISLRPQPRRGFTWATQNERRDITLQLQDAELSGNRKAGWNVTNPYYEVDWKGSRVRATTTGLQLDIQRDGALNLSVDFERLEWNENDKSIYPYILLELPSSFFRLAAHLLRAMTDTERRPIEHVAVDLVMFGLRGWGLRAGSPRSPVFKMQPPRRFDADHFELSAPIVFTWTELEESPDRCMFRLIREVYAEFGHPDDALPREYDQATGKLLLPT